MSTTFLITFNHAPDYAPATLADLSALFAAGNGATVAPYFAPPAPREERNSRGEYWGDVTLIARDIRAEHRKGSEGESDAAVHACDGSAWVIYTARAYAVLRHSSHSDAMEEEGMYPESMPTGGLDALITQAAYWALSADVRDALADMADESEEDESDESEE